MNASMFIDAVGLVDTDLIEEYVRKDNRLRSRRPRRGRRYLIASVAAAISVVLMIALFVTTLPLLYVFNHDKVDNPFVNAVDRVIFPLDDTDSEIKKEDLMLDWTQWQMTEQVFNALGAGSEDSLIDQLQSMQDNGLIGELMKKLGEFWERLYQYYLEHYDNDSDQGQEESSIADETEDKIDDKKVVTVELNGCTYRKGINIEYWTLIKVNETENGILEIPETIDGLPVKIITSDAAKELSDLREVIMPDTITRIGKYAFYGCTNLSSIEWSASLQEIGSYAFASCSALESVSLPVGVTKLGDYAFNACTVENEKGLKHVVLPEGLTSIPENCFSFNEFLTLVEIPASVTRIEEQAFYNCTSLSQILLPDDLRVIGTQAFANTDLISVEIPENVNIIDDSTFAGCESLITVHLPNSVTEIGKSAFERCSSLQDITLPSSLTVIGSRVFAKTDLKNIVIPSGVSVIGQYAFQGCVSLKSVTLERGTEEIGDYAFAGCTALQNVGLPEGLTIIGVCAFEECVSLAFVELPDGLTKVKTRAFAATALKQVHLPDTIRALGHQSFETVENVTMDVVAAFWYSDIIHRESSAAIFADGAMIKLRDSEDLADFTHDLEYSKIQDTGSEYVGCYEFTSLGLYYFIDKIDIMAYYDSSRVVGLKKVFYKNSFVQSVYMPDTIVYISPEEFMNCTELEFVRLSNSLEELPDRCFMGCTALKMITIPVSVKTIGNQAYAGCDALERVEYSGSMQEWEQIKIGLGAFISGTVIICTDGEVVIK